MFSFSKAYGMLITRCQSMVGKTTHHSRPFFNDDMNKQYFKDSDACLWEREFSAEGDRGKWKKSVDQ